MNEFATRRAAVIEYVRERLRAECASRGAAASLARKAGISSAHITNILKGPAAGRGVGDEVISKLAELWGFSSYASLEASALGEHAADDEVPFADDFSQQERLAIQMILLDGMPRGLAEKYLARYSKMARGERLHPVELARGLQAYWHAAEMFARDPGEADRQAEHAFARIDHPEQPAEAELEELRRRDEQHQLDAERKEKEKAGGPRRRK